MFVHDLLHVLVRDDAQQAGFGGQVVVLKLGSNAFAHVVALERQKWDVEVDQVAVDDAGVPESFLVFF